MNSKRCSQRKLSISNDRLLNKRKISRDVEEIIDAAVYKQTVLPPAPPCNFITTRKLIRTLTQEYTQLGQHLRAIIASELLKIEANQNELDEMKNLYNAMKMKEAENKRTRWCNWCELEASFLSCKGQFFYCSTECEETHLDSLRQFSQTVS